MKTQQATIILEDAISLNPTTKGVDYIDVSGMGVHIPMHLLIRLYEVAKGAHERNGGDWDSFCNSVFHKSKK